MKTTKLNANDQPIAHLDFRPCASDRQPQRNHTRTCTRRMEHSREQSRALEIKF